MHAIIISFCFVLIVLINDCKNVYSRNVCLGVCMMVFMKIATFKNYFYYEKGLCYGFWVDQKG